MRAKGQVRSLLTNFCFLQILASACVIVSLSVLGTEVLYTRNSKTSGKLGQHGAQYVLDPSPETQLVTHTEP